MFKLLMEKQIIPALFDLARPAANIAEHQKQHLFPETLSSIQDNMYHKVSTVF